MSYTVTQESFERLTSYWTDSSHRLKWGSVFVLPSWLEVWWREFQPGTELHLAAIRQKSDIIGIAPLQVKGKEASFVGSADVCDYLDFVIVPGRENDFFNALLDDLRQQGINLLDLRPLRPDSTVVTHLVGLAKNRGFEVLCQEENVTLELDLPPTWEDYLDALDKKQRHEVRRKLRRLWEAGNVDYRCLEVSPSVAAAMAEIKLLRFGILQVDALAAAMIMGFDYNNSMYLYNSAYDPQYNSLNVGLLSKVLCIKESIKRGMKKWDFLKGAERYKYQLGGNEIRLSNCQIIIK